MHYSGVYSFCKICNRVCNLKIKKFENNKPEEEGGNDGK